MRYVPAMIANLKKTIVHMSGDVRHLFMADSIVLSMTTMYALNES